MQDNQEQGTPLERAELYATLRSGIKDLQDDRNFQSQRFQTLAIALSAAYGFISVTIDGSSRPYFLSISLIALNIGVLLLAFFWRAQMLIFADAFKARYRALSDLAVMLDLPVNPYALDREHRAKVEMAASRWGPKTTSELQSVIPYIYFLFSSILTLLTIIQVVSAIQFLL